MLKPKPQPAAEETLSPRDRKILEVSRQIFASRGFNNTDVQEIADLLQIGKGTVYRAFGTKEELFFATVDYGMRQLSEKLASTSAATCGSPNALEAWILTFFSFFEDNPEMIELLMQERSEFRDRGSHSYIRHWLSNSPRWRARIQEAISDGRFRDVDADRLIDTLSAVCYGTIFISYFSKKKINLEQTAKFLTNVLQMGVLSDAERVERSKGRPDG